VCGMNVRIPMHKPPAPKPRPQVAPDAEAETPEASV